MEIQLIIIPISVIVINCIFHMFNIRKSDTDRTLIYKYNADTTYPLLNHKYTFEIHRVGNAYRCYIVSTPHFRGRDKSRYNPHYYVENGTNKHYICWTGIIANTEQAKALCRKWSDATQKFVDTGIPAPGFER